MKAKSVNESIDFKRGMGSKKSLGIGGWVPEEEFQEIKTKAWNEWKQTIKDRLEGQRIRFKGLMKNSDLTAHHTYLRVDKEMTVRKTKNDREFWAEFQLEDAETGQWYTITPKEKIEFL
jgi:hypothetical protein